MSIVTTKTITRRGMHLPFVKRTAIDLGSATAAIETASGNWGYI